LSAAKKKKKQNRLTRRNSAETAKTFGFFLRASP
jgi:hypothetical protein